MMKKICIVVGARPNFVKVAPLIRAIQKSGGAEYQLVYAGREDDPTLEPSLFDDLQMPHPEVFLGVDSQRLNEITAQVMGAFDRYLDERPADVVIVVDDLASTMAAAITAKKRGVKLAHLVAGTRSFDITMPKEVNRLVIDALSDYLFTAGVKSTGVATREQADGNNTYMVGNILMDSLRFNLPRFRRPDIDIEEGRYIVLTLNRRALLSDETCLRQMLQTMAETAADVPIIAPLRDSALNVVSRLLPSSSLSSLLCKQSEQARAHPSPAPPLLRVRLADGPRPRHHHRLRQRGRGSDVQRCALHHAERLYRSPGDRHRGHERARRRRYGEAAHSPGRHGRWQLEEVCPARPLGRSHGRAYRPNPGIDRRTLLTGVQEDRSTGEHIKELSSCTLVPKVVLLYSCLRIVLLYSCLRIVLLYSCLRIVLLSKTVLLSV